MKRPSLAEIEQRAAEYRAACLDTSHEDYPWTFLTAHRRLAWALCRSLYPDPFCKRRCRAWTLLT